MLVTSLFVAHDQVQVNVVQRLHHLHVHGHAVRIVRVGTHVSHHRVLFEQRDYLLLLKYRVRWVPEDQAVPVQELR